MKTIIANWKMNLSPSQSIDLAKEIHILLDRENIEDKQAVLCPGFLAISDVGKVLKDSSIALGAQDAFYQENGAYTGEICPEDLKNLGCEYVIVGHSERRAMGESDEVVNKKVLAVAAEKMIPVICVGERLHERQAKETRQVLKRQLSRALEGLPQDAEFIVAYEPVWSISTSRIREVISPQEALAEIDTIKSIIGNSFKNFQIIYGGSVQADSVAQFTIGFAGALVGQASLDAESFLQIIRKA